MKIYLIGKTGRMGREVAKVCTPVPLEEAACAIDFSAPEAIEAALPSLIAHKIPLVSGTTDLPPSLFDEAAKAIPLLHAPNFSLGIALITRAIPLFKKHAQAISIVERHHTGKKDAPSGTALALGKVAETSAIEAIREGEIVGEHTIQFTLDGEVIELKHTALDRSLFAKGALYAAKALCGKPPGRYTLEEVL